MSRSGRCTATRLRALGSLLMRSPRPWPTKLTVTTSSGRDRMTRSDRPLPLGLSLAGNCQPRTLRAGPVSGRGLRTVRRPRCTGYGVAWRPRRGCGGVGEPGRVTPALLLGGHRQRPGDRLCKEFRVPYHQLPPARGTDLQRGDEEIAMMLSLEPDASSSPNPTSRRAATGEGPLSWRPYLAHPGGVG